MTAWLYVAVSITWAPATASFEVGPALQWERPGYVLELQPATAGLDADADGVTASVGSGLRAWVRR